MNILFITIGRLADIKAPGIYTDLLRRFHQEGHEVYVVCPREKRLNLSTEYLAEDGFHFLRVRIGNITQCSIIEKGISTVLVERQYINAIQKYLRDVKFDLILYTTPPITFLKAVEYVKRRDEAVTYLLLKDIFPQNAVDIGIMTTTGLKGLLYKHFRRREKALYRVSDRIGCMSQANVDYVLDHNPEIEKKKVEVCPNSVDPVDMSCTLEERVALRSKYGIPLDKKVFVYGGNLGKPQGIPFIIDAIKACQNIEEAFFLIIGSGTDYKLLEKFSNEERPSNFKLMQRIPKEDYDKLAGCCDVGLIFLDHRFTIPNFPSRLLSYMQANLPVLACTDSNTDIGEVITQGEFGWWCKSDNSWRFARLVEQIDSQSLGRMEGASFRYLNNYYSTEKTYRTIMRSIK